MLEELRIRDLGVIEESVLELGPGFTAITGETGAGKTMVVTALGLLLGGRADSGAVRTGADRARVEGVVRLHGLPHVAHLVHEAGGECETDAEGATTNAAATGGSAVLARVVSAEGRSRAYAGGAGVPAALLSRIADELVAVHGQSDQHRLLQPGAQRDALDRFAGPAAAALREAVRVTFENLRATERERDEVVASARERAREADLLRFGVGEVDAVDPQPDEDETLAAEEGRLGAADTLRAAAEHAKVALAGDDDATGASGVGDALGLVGAARRALEQVREHDTEAAALADRLAEAGYVLADLAADVASYATGLETDPARLAAVSERRAAIGALLRKYGDTVAEVLAWAEHAATRLLDLDDTDGRIAALTERAAALSAELADRCGSLTAMRTEAAARLAAAVSTELAALAMPHARLSVAVRPARVGPTGADEVELLLAANPGAEPRPLGRGASGGELSRVMLGLEVALAGSAPVPTFVFDEVDAGVGGKAAVEVGRRLARLARSAQVLVVTHLPQVAAFADAHVVVGKHDDGRVTTSGLTVLDDTGRVRELSRMLAGLEDSGTARAHAEELLATARSGTRAGRRRDRTMTAS